VEPQGNPLLKVVANLLLDDVTLSALGSSALGPGNIAIDELKRAQGGLWVGGTFSIYEDAVGFEANALNSVFQDGTLAVLTPLSDITEVTVTRSLIFKTLKIRLHDTTLAVKCYRPEAVKLRILQQMTQAQRTQ
jgi:hypothetical protein